ncbi:hypothetical protein EA655_18985 [Pseudoxanthomonas winnipegensis]|uniref:Uncharacterized protein n=1 Tax=Pseudoxanthomonas winnipegensis TaxID=2480810 RepID=A0A4Q8LWE9_9GAMM|nr:hypothetical protein EA655_18985 [Pseudoxanthomonas winnipegensis]
MVCVAATGTSTGRDTVIGVGAGVVRWVGAGRTGVGLGGGATVASTGLWINSKSGFVSCTVRASGGSVAGISSSMKASACTSIAAAMPLMRATLTRPSGP